MKSMFDVLKNLVNRFSLFVFFMTRFNIVKIHKYFIKLIKRRLTNLVVFDGLV